MSTNVPKDDNYYRALLESSPDMLWEFDEHFIITFASPSSYNILGFSPEELIGKSVFDLMLPDEARRIRKQIAPITEKLEPFSHLLNINQHKDGREVFIESSGAPFFDAKGTFRGYRGANRDITKRQVANQESRQDTLFYLLNKGDLESSDLFLRSHGLDLLYDLELERFKSFVDIYAEDEIRPYGWVVFFIGTIALYESPPIAKAYFLSAHDTFIKNSDQLGILIGVSQLLYYFAFIECCYESGKELIFNIPEEVNHLLTEVDPTAAIHVAINLSIGYNFILCDYPKTVHFLKIASNLSATKNNDNIDALISFMRAMAANMNGKLELFSEEIELSCRYLNNENVSFFNKLLIQTMISNYYFWMGDYENLHRQSDEVYRSCRGNVVAKSSIDPWQLLMKADLEIGRDNLECARNFLDQAIEKGFASNLPHLQSQLYQSQALLLALRGEKVEALNFARKSEESRSTAGGAFFQLWNDCMLGTTYVILKKRQKARFHLGRAIQHGVQLNIEPMLAAAHACLAYQLIDEGKSDDACHEVKACLSVMKKHKMSNFFSWTPRIIKDVLCFAVKHDIEANYAHFLIKERLNSYIDHDGSLRPLLKIDLLDNMCISQNNQVLISSQEMSPAQRQFMALLICAPANRISQEKIQASLWPDKNTKNAQGAFDVFLHRWRKLLSSRLGKNNLDNFFISKRGVISINNCIIDSVQYEKRATAGLNWMRKGKLWKGWSDLSHAMNIWSGEHTIDNYGCEQLWNYQANLEILNEQVCLKWVAYLRHVDNIYESVNVLRRVLKTDNKNHAIVRELYHSHLLLSEKHAAQKLLKEYSDRLASEEYSQDEIQGIISEIFEYKISKVNI